MIMWHVIKKIIKQVLFSVPVVKNYIYGIRLAPRYIRSGDMNCVSQFVCKFHRQLYLERIHHIKGHQIGALICKIDIHPIKNDSFFYSIDCFKSLAIREHTLGNYTVDYAEVVASALAERSLQHQNQKTEFSYEEQIVRDALRGYLERCKQIPEIEVKFNKQMMAIDSLFERPAKTFFEALQRILFFNQFLWQTGHTLNGLGHLDWILEELYVHDLETMVMTREEAKLLLKDFFTALHEYYWFKSNVLMGDTGQIVILGGRGLDGHYHCNDLTYLFLEISKELRLPDPKVLLRCTADMPEDLLEAAIDCIATGIGAPLLSNDDVVIPAMISAGYDKADAYNYGTSACWEPLVPSLSCEENNVASLNYALPLTEMLSTPQFSDVKSMEDILESYEKHLAVYIENVLTPLTKLVFEKDPLLSLVSTSALVRQKDITRGGAKYNGLGLTSVGLGTVVNSLLNIKKFVFEEKRYTVVQMNEFRINNFAGQEELLQEMKDLKPCFGCDDPNVIELTRRIIAFTSREFSKYKTKLGGEFKFGLSSPSYISGANQIPATFDGRHSGEPFSVHISSATAIPTTELLSFAMQMDYRENRLNGNVIDFITSPGMLQKNQEKYAALLRAGFQGGIFQLQMNVVDSQTLLAAKADPTLFPNLVVRVWGFSAYFNDLPEEYKDVLIARALESEKAS